MKTLKLLILKFYILSFFLLFLLYSCSIPSWAKKYSGFFCHADAEISGDMEEFFVPESRIYKNSSQGMCLAGDYVIYTRYTSNSMPTTYVVIDRKTREEVGHYEFNTLHSNSLTYNPDTDEVVAVSESHAFIFDFDDGELSLQNDIVMNHNCPKIAYVSSEHTYYLGTTDTVYRTTDFHTLTPAFHCSHHNINQGMGFDGQYLYIIWYQVGHNEMDLYDLSGKFIRTFTLHSDVWREIEDVDFLGDTMYINIANSGSQDGIHTVKSVHGFSDWKTDKEPTCAKPGKHHHACTLCGKKEAEEIPPTGKHTPTDWITTAEPTCTQDGEHIKTCTVCGGELEKEPIPKLGHDFTRWEMTKEATVLEVGSKDRSCTRCDYTEHVDIPTLPAFVELNVEAIPLQKGHSTNCIQVTLNKGDIIKNWTSSDESIVTVDQNGEITAHKRGTAVVTVRSEGSATNSVTVKVQWLPVTTKSLKTNESIHLKKGGSTTMQVIKTPLTSTSKIRYSSSDKDIVTVSKEGVLKGKKKGKAIITVKSWFSKKKVHVTVE